MLVRRIIAVSSDEVFGQQLAAALQWNGEVSVHRSIDSLTTGDAQTALCVIHVDDELGIRVSELMPRLDCPLIAVLSRSNLAAVVDVMHGSPRVAGMMVAEDFDPRRLSVMATRILTDDVFGLEKLMAEGTPIHSRNVGDYREKSQCMSTVAEFTEQAKVPRRHREPIDQCMDEMLMNALYDAPVDAAGKHLFSEVPTTTRITMRTEHSVIVQYASDGKQFAVSVRDAFGTLDRPTVLRFLHKCVHATQSVDRRAAGAGLGLYLMLSSASAVYFNVLPGIATEVVCVFDLETSKPLEQFGFFVQSDPRGAVAAGPARAFPAVPPSRLRQVAMIAIPVVLVVAGVVAWPRVFGKPPEAHARFTTIPKGATIELEGRTVGTATDGTVSVADLEIGRVYPVVARLEGYEAKRAVLQAQVGGNALAFELRPVATVELDSQPPGAVVESDGTVLGTTPLTVTTLTPGASVTLSFLRSGYRKATERLEVPARGKVKRLAKQLELSDELVRVHFVSTPPGAAIVPSGQVASVDRTYTPADVFVEAGKVQRFTLTMPKHHPVVIEPFTPTRGATQLEKTATLADE